MNPLEQLQSDLVAYLLGNAETAPVPFTGFRRMVVESLADEAAAAWKVRVEGKAGLAALVLMPQVTAKYANVPGPQYGLEITVRLFEDPTVNNTGLTSESAGLSVLRWVDGLVIEDLTALYPSDKGAALRPNYDYPGFLVHDVVLAGELPQEMVLRTADPTITDDGAGGVTLGCADAGAAIYYTTDGSGPRPRLAAQLYAGVFQVTSGTAVRAIALKEGLLPSHVIKGVVSI